MGDLSHGADHKKNFDGSKLKEASSEMEHKLNSEKKQSHKVTKEWRKNFQECSNRLGIMNKIDGKINGLDIDRSQ